MSADPLGGQTVKKLGAVLLFGACYLVFLGAASELNASYIIRDAVVGPVIVAGVYAVLLSPAAIAAAGTVVLARVTDRVRFGLAVAFPFAIAAAVELLFAAAQSARFSEPIKRADLVLFAWMNAFFVLAFIAVGVLADRAAVKPREA